jgi:hypothetical protein
MSLIGIQDFEALWVSVSLHSGRRGESINPEKQRREMTSGRVSRSGHKHALDGWICAIFEEQCDPSGISLLGGIVQRRLTALWSSQTGEEREEGDLLT